MPDADILAHPNLRMGFRAHDGPNVHTKIWMCGNRWSIDSEASSSRPWTLSVRKIDENNCEYTNNVLAHPTQEFLDFIAEHGTPFQDAADARLRDGGNHNSRETVVCRQHRASRTC